MLGIFLQSINYCKGCGSLYAHKVFDRRLECVLQQFWIVSLLYYINSYEKKVCSKGLQVEGTHLANSAMDQKIGIGLRIGYYRSIADRPILNCMGWIGRSLQGSSDPLLNPIRIGLG